MKWIKTTDPRKCLLAVILSAAMGCHAQTIAEVETEIRRQGLPHPEIVLAQARLETGNFTSRRCREDRNIFGLKRNGRYRRYSRWQDSVTDYRKRISSRYTGGDYYAFLRRIGYAKDEQYCAKLRRF